MTNKKVGQTCTLQYMQCLSNTVRAMLYIGRPSTQLPVECVFSPYVLMYVGGNKLNFNIAGLS